MSNKFREQGMCLLLGLVGIGLPAEIINHFTGSLDPRAVLIGVVIANLIGFGAGAWSMSKKFRENNYDHPEVQD